MRIPGKTLLRRLGAGESIASVCQAAGISRDEFDAWWRSEIESRVPDMRGNRCAPVREVVEVERDPWGIPHVYAKNDDDLFFGFGYCLAQDRLFQLDYLRRKGAGRLGEILGPAAWELDLLARTVGLRRIAQSECTKIPAVTHSVLEAFSRGINAVLEESSGRLPIEFDLLDYEPEPWSPVDCLTIEGEFRWYLTGRFPVIVMPELAKRILGDGPLYQAFLTRESDAESIVPPGSYPAAGVSSQPVGVAAGDPQAGVGSNNWVVAGRRTTTGKPLLASDPHIAFEAVSCWYEVHLCGGSFNVAGMAYVGMPAVLFGRNERVAWGCTNNICSQRDLYQEKTDPAHAGCFLYDGKWEPQRRLQEVIQVKGAEPIRKTIRFSRNGPIVDEILPAPARQTGPVSLKWLGAYEGGWLTALLDMNRAGSAEEFRQATRPWHIPTFSLVFADVDGHIGYQMTGRIPIRNAWERGYRPGWDPEHQWDGLVPFDGLPRLADPERGWIVTANHRPAPNDFPYPLSGTWADDLRARRIREMIEAKDRLSRDDLAGMQQDVLSLRAVRCVPKLLEVLQTATDERVRRAAGLLASWDCRYETDRVGASIFELWFTKWCDAVAAARFDAETEALLVTGISGLAAALLTEDRAGWFNNGNGDREILSAFEAALDVLTDRLGPDVSTWTWGKLHTMPLRHVLSSRGELAALLDHGGSPVPGSSTTVFNTWPNPDLTVRSGAVYRLIADLNASPPCLWAVDAQSESGHPGSPHYRDQLAAWLAGCFHDLPLDRAEASKATVARLTLQR